MKKSSYLSLVFLLLFFASSCSLLNNFAKTPELDYLDKGTKMDIRKFFNGDIEGFAITQDDNGKILNTQTIKISGKWEDNKGVVQQNFVFADGTKDSRTWLFTVNADGTFDAIGHNVAGPSQGKQFGNAAQMVYSLLTSQNGVKQETKFVDKTYLVDDKSAILISRFRKSGASGKTIVSLKKLNSKSEVKIDASKVEIKDKDSAKND
jgi:hypothetical protein